MTREEAEKRAREKKRAATHWVCDTCRSSVYKGHRFPPNCLHPDGPCPEVPR